MRVDSELRKIRVRINIISGITGLEFISQNKDEIKVHAAARGKWAEDFELEDGEVITGVFGKMATNYDKQIN